MSRIATPPVSRRNIRSRERVRDLAEVFTAEREVRAMLDLIGDPTHKVETTFLEPSCGNGNFLVEILDRKLSTVFSRSRRPTETERGMLRSLMAIYGVDLCPDNAEEARERLRDRVRDAWSGRMNTRRMSAEFVAARDAVLAANVRAGNFLTGRAELVMIEYVSLPARTVLRPFLLSEPGAPLGTSRPLAMNELPSGIAAALSAA